MKVKIRVSLYFISSFFTFLSPVVCSRDVLKSICLDTWRFTRPFETSTWPLRKQFRRKRDRNRYLSLNPLLRSRWRCIRQFYDSQIRTNSLGCRKRRAFDLLPSSFCHLYFSYKLCISACNFFYVFKIP